MNSVSFGAVRFQSFLPQLSNIEGLSEDDKVLEALTTHFPSNTIVRADIELGDVIESGTYQDMIAFGETQEAENIIFNMLQKAGFKNCLQTPFIMSQEISFSTEVEVPKNMNSPAVQARVKAGLSVLG